MPEEHHVTGAGPRWPRSAVPEEEDAVSWQPPRLSHPSASASAAAGPIASCSTPLPRGYSGGPGALMSANEASRSMRLPGCKSAPHHPPKWALWLLRAGGEQLRGWAAARLLSLQEEQRSCCGMEGPACNAGQNVPGAGRQRHGCREVPAAASMSCRHPLSAISSTSMSVSPYPSMQGCQQAGCIDGSVCPGPSPDPPTCQILSSWHPKGRR